MTQSRPDAAGSAATLSRDDPARAGLALIATGVAVVTAIDRGVPIGVTLQCVSPVSSDPPIAVICPAVGSATWARIAAQPELCINVLAEAQTGIARRFSAAGIDRFSGVEWSPGRASGAPVLAGGLCAMEARMESATVAGDHWIVACRVTSIVLKSDGRPLVYFKRRFARIDPEP